MKDLHTPKRYANLTRIPGLLVGLLLVSSFPVQEVSALNKSVMPSDIQTDFQEPRERLLSLKLPLKQPVFHWTFLEEDEVLAGRLVLKIVRGDETQEIVIFEDGQYAEGWSAIPLDTEGAGEVYFGFQSSKRFPTAPDDKLLLEFTVPEDLAGIGAQMRGVLPAGEYRSEGGYSALIDEFNLTALEENLAKSDKTEKEKQETLDRMREMYDHKAFLENWEEEWSLEITEDQGWLTPEANEQYEKLMSRMEEQRTKEANLDRALQEAGFDTSNPKERIAGLKRLLIGEDLDLGNLATNALWREGNPAIPALVEVLSDEVLDPEVRLRAAISLDLMAVNKRAKPEAFAEEAVPALLDVIQNECEEAKKPGSLDCISLRNQSMNALSSMGEAGWVAIPVLIKLLDNENMGIQAGAAIALGRMGPVAKEAIPLLEEMSRVSGSENLKMHVTEALKQIRE